MKPTSRSALIPNRLQRPSWLQRPRCEQARHRLALAVVGLVLLASDFAHGAVGDLDLTFDPDVTGANGANVVCTAVQTDNRILIGGQFDALGGASRNDIARLQPDGTVDPGFNPNVSNASNEIVNCIAIQVDGNIVIGGRFNAVGGVTRHNIARVSSGGAVDTTFNPDIGGEVTNMVVQPDEKIIVTGYFATVGGAARKRIVRLNMSGAVDPTFNAVTLNTSGYVLTAALQLDGKVIIGGEFTTVNGAAHAAVARLNGDGTLDASFNASVDYVVQAVAVQNTGGILLGGYFFNVNGVSRTAMAAIASNGTLIPSFDSRFNSNTSPSVFSIANMIGAGVIAGDFSILGGTLRHGVAWIANFPPSHPDLEFSYANNVMVQADNNVIVGGYFTSARGVVRHGLARLLNSGWTEDILAPEDTHSLKWLRNGALPEAQDVTFDLSTDGGTTWTRLGNGTRRYPGVLSNTGWNLAGVNLPMAGMLRARARIVGGIYNGSSGLIEKIASYTNLLPPYENWKRTWLGDPNAPDLADSNGDGLVNLVEYGLAGLPVFRNRPPAPQRHVYPEGVRLRMLVNHRLDFYDVTVTVQASDSVLGPWTDLATSILGAPFTGPGFVRNILPGSIPETLEIRDIVNLSDAPQRFMRVQVTH